MESLAIVDLFDEAAKASARLLRVTILAQVDLLALQGFEEALGPRILVGISASAHADGKTMASQPFQVDMRTVLNSAVGVMHHARPAGPLRQGAIERPQSQCLIAEVAAMTVRRFCFVVLSARTAGRPDELLTPLAPPPLVSDRWEWLADEDDPAALRAIGYSIRAGLPLGRKPYSTMQALPSASPVSYTWRMKGWSRAAAALAS